jgi:hypothetical protein
MYTIIPDFASKTKYSSYVCPGSLFHTYGQKVFTDNQMLPIKYIYYIDNVSKD